MVTRKYDHPHLINTWTPVEPPRYEPVQGGGGADRKFSGPGDGTSRKAHATALKNSLVQLIADANQNEEESILITFRTFPGMEAILEDFENRQGKSHIEVLSSKRIDEEGNFVDVMNVRLPVKKAPIFLKRIQAYSETIGDADSVAARFGDSVREIMRSTLEQLWLDDQIDLYGYGDQVWWEAWFDKSSELSINTSNIGGIFFGPDVMEILDRKVCLIRANRETLETRLGDLDGIVGFRKPAEPMGFLTSESLKMQESIILDFQKRLRFIPEGHVVINVIDTGVQNGHRLLEPALSVDDLQVVKTKWPLQPEHPHGTEMAGLSLFGRIEPHIAGDNEVVIQHRLESTKIIRRPGDRSHEARLYGAVTALAVDLVESKSSDRRRVHLMPLTACESESVKASRRSGTFTRNGEPTSWSSAIDAMAFGRVLDHVATQEQDTARLIFTDEAIGSSRLFVVPAGNVDVSAKDPYLDVCDSSRVLDPGQSWNALTVGAFTELDIIQEDWSHQGIEWIGTLATKGGLSPSSRTSINFDTELWPPKPDLVAEGGNIATFRQGTDIGVTNLDSLSPLTTGMIEGALQTGLTTTRDTSSACAIVSNVAAQVSVRYPKLKPETVRGLLIHTAEWTSEMLGSKPLTSVSKEYAKTLRRRYGMGTVSLERALASAMNDLVLVQESELVPFMTGKNSNVVYGDCHFHTIRWPVESLRAIAGTQVQMRVTLSYFMDPNPSPRGWRDRYSYQSHGLRFEVNSPTENIADFRKRINKADRIDGEKGFTGSPQGWLFGSKARSMPGSLITDIWHGDAAKLADMRHIAIYPVSGWWKFRKRDHTKDVAPYSLIVSVSTDQEIDLWQEVVSSIPVSDISISIDGSAT